jgi:hypothetical protein
VRNIVTLSPDLLQTIDIEFRFVGNGMSKIRLSDGQTFPTPPETIQVGANYYRFEAKVLNMGKPNYLRYRKM